MTNVRHLFHPNGQPSLTRADHELLHQARRLAPNTLKCAHNLQTGLLNDNPATVKAAILQLRSISLFLDTFIEAESG